MDRKRSDPDLTPVVAPRAQEFLRDQCAPTFENEVPTQRLERCPCCYGTGETEHNRVFENRYSIRYVTCWLCKGAKIVPEETARDWIALTNSSPDPDV